MAAFTSDSSFASDYGSVTFSSFDLVGPGRTDRVHDAMRHMHGNGTLVRQSGTGLNSRQSALALSYRQKSKCLLSVDGNKTGADPADSRSAELDTMGIAVEPQIRGNDSDSVPEVSHNMTSLAAEANMEMSTMQRNSTSQVSLKQMAANSTMVVSAADPNQDEAHAEYGTFIPVGGYEPPPPVPSPLPPPPRSPSPPGSSSSSSTASSPSPPPASSAASTASPPPPPTASSSVGA